MKSDADPDCIPCTPYPFKVRVSSVFMMMTEVSKLWVVIL